MSISEVMLAYTAAACVLAIWKGERAERLAAALIAADWLFISAAQLLWAHDSRLSLRAVAAPVLIADLLMCFGFLWIMLRHGDLWVGAALLIQGAQLAVYGSYLARDGASAYTHTLLINVCSFLLLDVLLVGVALAWRRRVRERRDAGPMLAVVA